jgi:hypothetical protein
VEIGPIVGIRPVPMIRTSSPAPDLAGVFAVELRKQAHEDAPPHQRVARGLEDEEADAASVSAEDESSFDDTAPDAQPHSRVSFFA